MRSVRYLFAAAFLFVSAAQPVAIAKSRDDKPGAKCEPKKKKHSMFGAIAGTIAGNAMGRMGVPTGVVGISVPVGSLIGEGISRLLNCKEQVQAATATQEAVRGGVGTTSSWNSESRPGVKGASSVKSQTARADGSSCMNVSDVVIVDGEETMVNKTMCRAPGAANYTLMA
jgi:hypothetical protein